MGPMCLWQSFEETSNVPTTVHVPVNKGNSGPFVITWLPSMNLGPSSAWSSSWSNFRSGICPGLPEVGSSQIVEVVYCPEPYVLPATSETQGPRAGKVSVLFAFSFISLLSELSLPDPLL